MIGTFDDVPNWGLTWGNVAFVYQDLYGATVHVDGFLVYGL